MATTQKKPSFEVFERITKTVKNKPKSVLTPVKFPDEFTAVKKLKEKRSAYFEIVFNERGVKHQYNKLISGNNYEQKVVKI